jgi:hypothetical protein
MSSSSSPVEEKVRPTLVARCALPSAAVPMACTSIRHAADGRQRLAPHTSNGTWLTRRVAHSERPLDGVRPSSRWCCITFLTVSQTPHHHLGVPHGFCEAHHRRPAPLPLLAPVRHPLQQDWRPALQGAGLALEDRHIHIRLAPADAPPRTA